jgi:aminopeptidase N
MLFTPLDTRDKKQVELAMAHQMAHAALHSPRPWISEGLANFAQLLVRERQNGRHGATDYLNTNLAALIAAEKQNTDTAKLSGDAAHSLVATTDEIYYRVKAMYVWSMLRDIVGENELQAAVKNYQAAEDKEPSYVQRLVAAQSKRDLEWFFDDWVYRDRGLPEFKIESAIPRETLHNSYVVAVTVENSGSAGAEIPVTVRSASGEQTQRLMVQAHQKATTRLSVPGKPTEVTVNGGAVPERDASNDRLELK